MITRRGEPMFLIALAIRLTTASRLLGEPSPARVSILADRSRTRTTVSIEPPPQPSQFPMSGRATAKMSAAMARVRQTRMRMCLSRFLPRDSREALSKKVVAAHFTVRKRRRLSR